MSPIKTDIDIHAATERAHIESTYAGDRLNAAIIFKKDDDTDLVVGVRRRMPAEQGEAWADFLGNISNAVSDGKLDLTDVAKVGLSSDLGKLF